MFETITTLGNQKVWGKNSLTMGEIAGFAIGALLILFGARFLGKWHIWVGLLTIFVSAALF